VNEVGKIFMSVQSNFLLFMVFALTAIELLMFREEITLPVMLMLTLGALLSIIAIDVSKILRTLQDRKGDN